MISVLLRIQRSVSGPQHKKNTKNKNKNKTQTNETKRNETKRNETKRNETKRNNDETKRKKTASNITLYLVRLRVEVNARESVAALVML